MSPWEVTERLEGSAPLGPCSQGVLGPCCLPEPQELSFLQLGLWHLAPSEIQAPVETSL